MLLVVNRFYQRYTIYRIISSIQLHSINIKKHYQSSNIMHQFDILKQLGSGSFGRVLKVRRKDDSNIFAMKTVKMLSLNSKEKDNALNQVRILASIDSPNVIGYKGAFFQECGNILSIIMEYADGGDLAGLIQKKATKKQFFEENFIWKVANDLLRGLKFIHSNHIIHRDIKAANIFFVDGTAKLGDMNVSKVMEGKFATTQTGTPYYTSPQIWQGKKYTSNCDIWSLGCLLYELCALRPPFMANDFPGLMKKVAYGYYDQIPSRYSKKLSALIRKCLTVDFTRRPTSSQLLQYEVFQLMNSVDEGEIDLLDTIKCPRVLKLINLKLPEDQYIKKPKTLKLIVDEPPQRQQSYDRKQQRYDMKRIRSEKNIRCSSMQKKQNQNRALYNKNMNAVLQSPQGYVKLPKIPSQRHIF